MSNDPNTGKNTALEYPVNGPSKVGKWGREEVEVIGGSVVEEEGKGEVVNDVRE